MYIILLSYFLLGLSSITAIADTLFGRNVLHLSPSQLISLGIWTALPWSAKILFSSVIDTIKIGGSQRRSYMILASILGLLSSIAMSELACPLSYLRDTYGEYLPMLVIGIAVSVSTVILRLLLDTLMIEKAETAEIKAKIQVQSRNVFILGGLLGAVLSGVLASTWSLSAIYLVGAIGPVAILMSLLVPGQWKSYKNPVTLGKFSTVGIAAGFVLAVTLLGLTLSDVWAQLAVFAVSIGLFSTLLYRHLGHLSTRARIGLLTTISAIFLFRTNIDAGPALTWYYMDVWKFTPLFLGTLRTVGYAASVIAMFAFRNMLIDRTKLTRVLIALTVGLLILALPDILIFYGHTFGISPRHLVLADSAGADALAQAAMIPLGVIVAFSAPEEGKVTYLALVASLMNLALLLSSLVSKFLNSVYPVSRGSYANLGRLEISALLISVGLSILGIGLLKGTRTQLSGGPLSGVE